MTYRSRGRSITEVMIATIFVGFLTGFVTVLCIGNYFRAKRAMERQKQRRLARLASGGGNGVVVDSPQSSNTSGSYRSSREEQQHLLSQQQQSHRNWKQTRRRNYEDDAIGQESLLLQVDEEGPLMSV